MHKELKHQSNKVIKNKHPKKRRQIKARVDSLSVLNRVASCRILNFHLKTQKGRQKEESPLMLFISRGEREH